MDREATTKQMKALKAKGRAARKAGKREDASGFRAASRRLSRKLKATAPRGSALHKKADEAAAPAQA